ncbi:hypothetical protein OSTOST_20175 [Ostertagia ostertagi]
MSDRSVDSSSTAKAALNIESSSSPVAQNIRKLAGSRKHGVLKRAHAKVQAHVKYHITLSLNCPRLPDPAYAYNETFVRYYITPLLPHVAFYKTIDVKCATEMPDTKCHGYTAWDPVEKAIIIAFRGTDGKNGVPFFNNGHLFKYFHDAFFFLWNGGLEQQVRTLKFQYPNYKFYLTGISLGASIVPSCFHYEEKLET